MESSWRRNKLLYGICTEPGEVAARILSGPATGIVIVNRFHVNGVEGWQLPVGTQLRYFPVGLPRPGGVTRFPYGYTVEPDLHT